MKHNLYTPGSRIKILPASSLKRTLSCVLYHWLGIFREIKKRVEDEGVKNCLF